MNVLSVYLISAVVLVVAGYVFFRIFFRRDYQELGRLSVGSILFGSLLFFTWGGFPYLYGPLDWPEVHIHPLLEMVGWFCLAGGLALMIMGMASLGFKRTIGQKQNRLKQGGPYRLSRNPQLLGCGLYGIGFAVLWPSWYALGWVLMFAPLAHMMVMTEEEHLRRLHGQKYEHYCERVPRYLGIKFGAL